MQRDFLGLFICHFSNFQVKELDFVIGHYTHSQLLLSREQAAQCSPHSLFSLPDNK